MGRNDYCALPALIIGLCAGHRLFLSSIECNIQSSVKDCVFSYKKLILSILVYTFFSRMFDLMLPPVAKHSIVVA